MHYSVSMQGPLPKHWVVLSEKSALAGGITEQHIAEISQQMTGGRYKISGYTIILHLSNMRMVEHNINPIIDYLMYHAKDGKIIISLGWGII